MLPPARPSILLRPVRQEGGRANVELADAEYEREQRRLAAKGARQAEHEERLVRAFYPTEEDKRAGW